MAAGISSKTICPKSSGISKDCKGELLEKIKSKDGTTITFDRLGDGPPVIVVGGATCDRAMTRPLAERLAQHFTVINYDRRGRGDSEDRLPYAVEREIEDLGTLIAEAVGTGGGKADAGWDGSGMPNARLAILPATTHYDIFSSPVLASAVTPFLDAPMPEAGSG
jgi:pimeloyl-ACP methyl ester carboxylesterase